ncbi:hypothetical protein [Stakelama marina]|uniref:hypothetical protein n=1 Tax=Stakelama marina TaxID=2826939 RepID=UPI0024C31D97|nr:hypothetical protein [Stakelama marina]
MKISRTSVALGAIAVALTAAGIPAVGQDVPESLLPPGFNEPATPAPTPAPTSSPTRRAPTPVPSPVATPAPAATPESGATPEPTPTPTPTQSVEEMMKYELPPSAKRSLERVGFAAPRQLGFTANGYGGSDGQLLEALMRRVDAPLPSRWLSIGLRRALTASMTTPPRVNGADFAAERAWLLLRMGEANAARGVVQSVDVDNYTPKLFQIAMQASLATGDPAGMCPLVAPAQQVSSETSWTLAAAMCAALGGEPKKAGDMIDAARRKSVAHGIDIGLAEKVVGRGSQGRRDVSIEWDGVGHLTAWRYGLAIATGVDIPRDLIDNAGPQVRYWRALSPYLAPSVRLPDAESAAAQGVFSSAALVDLYGQIDAEADDAAAQIATARDLRSAYTEPAAADRIAMLRRLWSEPSTRRGRFARTVLTAEAAERIAPNKANAQAADDLIASMLTAGLDIAASRWAPVVERGSQGWALLALSDPEGVAMLRGSDVRAYRDNGAAADRRKAQMFLAGLAGLGRVRSEDVADLAKDLDVQIGMSNAWTQAIDKAGQRREGATVMLLAAIGMQTSDWRGVPPEALFHIVSALRAAGLEGYARMIAAEAVARV